MLKILFLTTIAAVSTFGQRTELKELEKADSAVVGIVRTGTETATRIDFELEVLRTLKGSQLPGSKIKVQFQRADWPLRPDRCPEPCTRSLQGPVTGVFFLQSRGSFWVPLIPRSGQILGGQFRLLFLPTEDSLSSSATSLPNRSRWGLLEAYLAEIVSSAEGRSPGRVGLMYHTLEFEDQLAIPALRALRNSSQSTQDVSDRALTLLVKRADPESFSDLERSASRIEKTSEFRQVIEGLRAFRINTPAAFLGLRSLYESPNVPLSLRYAAAGAMADIHPRQALPLFEKMLFGSDPIFQAYGAVGIGMLANGCGTSGQYSGCARGSEAPRPAYWTPELLGNRMTVFNPEKHSVARSAPRVAFWQDWWKANSKLVLLDPRPR